MICPISIYLRPAEQVGLHKVCTRLCIEFLLLTLSCKVENPSLFKNFFLLRDNPGFFPSSEILFQLLVCILHMYSYALVNL